jgi:hypothetical protein
MLDGSSIDVFIAALALPLRVTATKNATTGILTYTNEPVLWTTGSTTGKLIRLVGASELDITDTKKNVTYRLFNDDGWEQDKIVSQNWQATLQAMFVKDAVLSKLDDSFSIIYDNSTYKEEEVYLKTRKAVGPGVAVGSTLYQIQAGNAKVITVSEQAPAEGLIKLSVTLKGQGKFITGFEEIV